MIKVLIQDRKTYAITTQREYTDEGFLKVPARVARTGIQDYHAVELGLSGDPHRIVRVMRPADEVFNQASLDTYKGADVTIEHPDGMVDSETFKSVSVGISLDSGRQDGDFVECDLVIKDKEGIRAAEQGKVQLSVGYTAIYDDNVPEDADYEYIQREIRVNHVALVDRARAGAQARLYDNQPTRKIDMKIINLDSGNTVEIEDASAATLINDTIGRLQQEVKDAKADTDKVQATADNFKEKFEESEDNLEEEKKKSSEDAISLRIKDTSILMAQAAKIGSTEETPFVCDSIDGVAIRRAALAVARPKIEWADKSDDYVMSSFDIAMENEEEETEDEDKKKKEASDSYKNLSNDASSQQITNQSSARTKSNDSMTNAWKKTAAGGNK